MTDTETLEENASCSPLRSLRWGLGHSSLDMLHGFLRLLLIATTLHDFHGLAHACMNIEFRDSTRRKTAVSCSTLTHSFIHSFIHPH